jgi:hypothetical protein
MTEKRKKIASDKLIDILAGEPIGITDAEYRYEQTSEQYDYSRGINQYDELVLQALHDHQVKRIPQDDGGIFRHPTALAFRIGIKSILTGRPSRKFLRLLLEIAEQAENYDVMQLVFPKEFYKIKSGTIESAKLYAEIAAAFKAHLQKYRKSPDRLEYTGKGEKARRLRKIDFAEAKCQFKNAGTYEPKTIDRALSKYGLDWAAHRVSVKLEN